MPAKPDSQAAYAPLLAKEEGSDEDVPLRQPEECPSFNSALKNRAVRFLIGVLCFTIALNLGLAVKYIQRLHYDPTLQVYSPANSAVEWRVQKFHRGFGKDTQIYEMPPSPEVDKAWKELYEDFTGSRITRKEAEAGVNATAHIWRADGYMAALDIFHQLHCLDMLRMALHPQDYPDLDLPPGHMRHCIGVMRQSAMCASDVNLDVWQWSDKVHRVASRTDVLHTCRNFEKIQDWARKRFIPGTEWTPEDFALHVPDNLVVKGWD